MLAPLATPPETGADDGTTLTGPSRAAHTPCPPPASSEKTRTVVNFVENLAHLQLTLTLVSLTCKPKISLKCNCIVVFHFSTCYYFFSEQ